MEEGKKIILATPVHDTSSSVFLTPPLSDKPSNKTQAAEGMVSQKFPLIQNLMLTPTSPEQLKTEEHDIVTRFYLQGFPLIVEKIFSHLSAADLQKCVAVSYRWKLFCTNLKSIASRLPAKTDEQLKQKENQVPRRAHKKQTDHDRHPLTVHSSNIIMSSQKVAPLSIPQTKQTKCPSCSSPAKEYNFVHAKCCSCSYSFCPSCLGKAHADNKSCSKIRSSPTKRESSQLGIGTKKSKKRLRRL